MVAENRTGVQKQTALEESAAGSWLRFVLEQSRSDTETYWNPFFFFCVCVSFFFWRVSDARGDVIVFTRPEHIIYGSDSKAERSLFLWMTAAAEETGAWARCAWRWAFSEAASAPRGLLGVGKLRQGARQWFGCTRVWGHPAARNWVLGHLPEILLPCRSASVGFVRLCMEKREK